MLCCTKLLFWFHYIQKRMTGCLLCCATETGVPWCNGASWRTVYVGLITVRWQLWLLLIAPTVPVGHSLPPSDVHMTHIQLYRNNYHTSVDIMQHLWTNVDICMHNVCSTDHDTDHHHNYNQCYTQNQKPQGISRETARHIIAFTNILRIKTSTADRLSPY